MLSLACLTPRTEDREGMLIPVCAFGVPLVSQGRLNLVDREGMLTPVCAFGVPLSSFPGKVKPCRLGGYVDPSVCIWCPLK